MKKIIFEDNRTLDLICLGRAGIDLNPLEFNSQIEEVTTFKKSVGGSPANIAVGAAKMGLKVGFIGRVANNGIGRYIVQYFIKNNIDTASIIFDEKAANSLALTEVLTPNQCGAIFYMDHTADQNLNCGNIHEEYIRKSKSLLISGTALAQSPSREAVFLAVEYAKKNNTKVIIDLDYRAYAWKSLEETAIYYSLLCEKSDIIIGTREEFNVLELWWDKKNINDKKSADRWIDKGSELIVITKGKDGSVAYSKDGEVIRFGIIPAKEKKTFGAGDAYASSLLACIIKGKSIEKSILYGAVSASIVISRTDCTEAMPTEKEIEEIIIDYVPD
jgi:5-dehydro-2-deoxygluconokinase